MIAYNNALLYLGGQKTPMAEFNDITLNMTNYVMDNNNGHIINLAKTNSDAQIVTQFCNGWNRFSLQMNAIALLLFMAKFFLIKQIEKRTKQNKTTDKHFIALRFCADIADDLVFLYCGLVVGMYLINFYYS